MLKQAVGRFRQLDWYHRIQTAGFKPLARTTLKISFPRQPSSQVYTGLVIVAVCVFGVPFLFRVRLKCLLLVSAARQPGDWVRNSQSFQFPDVKTFSMGARAGCLTPRETCQAATQYMKFIDLGLSQPILDAIEEQGYDTPSPIQEKAIPHVLEGRDVMAAAQTGTGKTAGFTLPILHRLSNIPKPHDKRNQARALIVTPTRELAAQVAASVETYGQNLNIKSAVVFGGVKINPQMQKLRGGVDILIATPGRLLDLQSQNAIQLNKLEILVLDEADRMLDMGFIHDIKRIMKLLPVKRQTLMFSATFSPEIRQLAKGMVHEPVEVSVSPANSTVDSVKQRMVTVEKADKTAVLAHLINDNNWFQVLVFSRTKHGANKLVKKLIGQGIEAAAIHGNKSQGARTKVLAEFKQSKVRVLVATDIAARGIDIDQLPYVVNFDLPNVPEDYVHRIGRTGRAGASGEAVSLVSHDEFKQLRDIERLIKKTIPREVVEGFAPLNNVPESKADFQDRKPKKLKKPKTPGGDSNSGGNRGSASARSEGAPARKRSSRRRGKKKVTGRSADNGGQTRGGQTRGSQTRGSQTGENQGNGRRAGSSSKSRGNAVES